MQRIPAWVWILNVVSVAGGVTMYIAIRQQIYWLAIVGLCLGWVCLLIALIRNIAMNASFYGVMAQLIILCGMITIMTSAIEVLMNRPTTEIYQSMIILTGVAVVAAVLRFRWDNITR